MKYRVTYLAKNDVHRVPISPTDFEEARQIKEVVVTLLGFEERFNILIENYGEFERELLNITLDNALSTGVSWGKFTDSLHTLNRRLINLLTTCKLYLDQLHHTLSGLDMPDQDLAGAVREKCSHEYDSRIGYRVMEALRNHVQHRGLPIHRISHSDKWRDDRIARKHTATVFILPSRLADDPKFKKSVLRELQQMSDVVDLKPLVREYLTGIIAIHQFVRDQLKDLREQRDGECLGVISSKTTESESATSIVFQQFRGDGAIQREFSLFNDLVERRHTLERKNRSFGDLAKLIISSE